MYRSHENTSGMYDELIELFDSSGIIQSTLEMGENVTIQPLFSI